MRRRVILALLFLLPALLALPEPLRAEGVLDRKVREKVAGAVFEVVVRKPEDRLTYDRPLPLELLPYTERTDPYRSVGTAFAISPTELVTAAHVLGLERESQYRDSFIRDASGAVYPVEKILRYSNRRDFVVFSVAGRKFDDFFPLNPSPEVNSKVYAVGNALGEGIVIRDGLFTSETPEETSGEWKWLRFSAAASPGNSGGPLLDEQGGVIGVVLRKSRNENLNMALPIRQVSGASTDRAEIFQRLYYKPDNMQIPLVSTFAWETALPAPVEPLRREIIAASRNALTQLAARYETENREKIFPRGQESLALLNRRYHDEFPRIISMGPDGRWDAPPPGATRKLRIGANGSVTVGMQLQTLLVKMAKPDDIPLEKFTGDSKLFMDSLLQAIGATRSVGIDRVRVLSFGPAVSETGHLDAYGRQWKLRVWSSPWDDSQLEALSLPVPGGAVALIRVGPTAATFGNLFDLKKLADFVAVSYCGTLRSWREFLALNSPLPPAIAAKTIAIGADGTLSYRSDRLVFSLDGAELKLGDASELHLGFGYFTDGDRTAWDVEEIVVNEGGSGGASYRLTRHSRPPAELDDSDRAEWKKVAARATPFDRSVYTEDTTTSIGTVLPAAAGGEKGDDRAVLYTVDIRKEGTPERREMTERLDRFAAGVTILEPGAQRRKR